RPAPLIEASSTPQLELTAGDHQVTGAFLWDALPEALEVPPQTGLVSLSVDGKPIAVPNRDAQGLLYLAGNAAAGAEAEQLDIRRADGAEGAWPEEEIWVFDSRPQLRVVLVEGKTPVDPQQTTLPNEWKSLPAWRLKGRDALTLTERRRGDADPGPDRLALT